MHPGAGGVASLSRRGCVRVVSDEELQASAGGIVVEPSGANRAVRAVSDVVFLDNLGDPGSETPLERGVS